MTNIVQFPIKKTALYAHAKSRGEAVKTLIKMFIDEPELWHEVCYGVFDSAKNDGGQNANT